MKKKRQLFPPWNMPSDPIKAVFWFLHWFLRVLVRYFYILILIGVIFESYINWRVSGAFNGVVAGVITLLVGLVVWGGLAVVLAFFNVSAGVSKSLSDLGRMRRSFPPQRPFNDFVDSDIEGNVVEGTVTDLEEERRKRRPE